MEIVKHENSNQGKSKNHSTHSHLKDSKNHSNSPKNKNLDFLTDCCRIEQAKIIDKMMKLSITRGFDLVNGNSENSISNEDKDQIEYLNALLNQYDKIISLIGGYKNTGKLLTYEEIENSDTFCEEITSFFNNIKSKNKWALVDSYSKDIDNLIIKNAKTLKEYKGKLPDSFHIEKYKPAKRSIKLRKFSHTITYTAVGVVGITALASAILGVNGSSSEKGTTDEPSKLESIWDKFENFFDFGKDKSDSNEEPTEEPTTHDGTIDEPTNDGESTTDYIKILENINSQELNQEATSQAIREEILYPMYVDLYNSDEHNLDTISVDDFLSGDLQLKNYFNLDSNKISTSIEEYSDGVSLGNLDIYEGSLDNIENNWSNFSSSTLTRNSDFLELLKCFSLGEDHGKSFSQSKENGGCGFREYLQEYQEKHTQLSENQLSYDYNNNEVTINQPNNNKSSINQPVENDQDSRDDR